MDNELKINITVWLEVLQVTFLILKMLDIMKWTWLWVLSPIWIPALIVLFVIYIKMVVGKLKQLLNWKSEGPKWMKESVKEYKHD